MAKGAYYPIYQKMWLYTDTFSAADYGSVGLQSVSTVSPNTGSDKDKYNAIYNGEKGNCYVNTEFGWSYVPTVNLWWVREAYGGVGWGIGWTNDEKNGFPLTVGDASGVSKRAKGVWVGDASGVPRKAKAVYVGDAAGAPRKAK